MTQAIKGSLKRRWLAALAAAALLPLLAAPARALTYTCDTTYTVIQAGGGTCTTISACVALIPSTVAQRYCIDIQDSAVYIESVTISGLTNTASYPVTLGSLSNLKPTLRPPVDSLAAVMIATRSINIVGIRVEAPNAMPYGIYASSHASVARFVSVSSVSIDGGANITFAGVSLYGDGELSYSSITTNGAAGLLLTGDQNVVSYSTMVITAGGGASRPALWLMSYFPTSNPSGVTYYSVSNNTIKNVYVYNPDGHAAYVEQGANTNTFSSSTIRSDAADNAALFVIGNSNKFTDLMILNPAGIAAWFDGVSNIVERSTMSAGGSTDNVYGFADTGNNNRVGQSYIQGSTAAFTTSAIATSFESNVIVATGAYGSGLWLSASSYNAWAASNSIAGGVLGAGLKISDSLSSVTGIRISSNTIYGAVRLSTAGAGPGYIWITSNTVLPYLTAAGDTYGLYINGLVTGATFYNNSILYRAPGSMGAFTTYGMWGNTVNKVSLYQNRISNPGMVTGGGMVGAYFAGTTATDFKFNDVNSTGSLETAYLMQLEAGSTVYVRNNIFLSSFSVTAASATLLMSANSGILSSYNNWFSSNSFNTAIWGGAPYQMLGGWRSGTGKDALSISTNPYWNKTGLGFEDFHPLSPAGRFDPATQAYVATDLTRSPTIDRGDPLDAFGNEPSPNAGTANQGSYGNTTQASKSPTWPTTPVRVGPPAAYVSTTTPVFEWTAGVKDYRLVLATDPNFYQFVADSTTANSYAKAAPDLAHGTTYWSVVNGSSELSLWSSTASVTVDVVAPAFSSPQVTTNPATGPWMALPSALYMSSNVVSLRVNVQDALSGLKVSTGVPAGLLGHWHLDESSGSVIMDASTRAANGMAVSGASWTDGKRGAALRFSGGAQQAQVPDNNAWTFGADFTISAWVRFNSVSASYWLNGIVTHDQGSGSQPKWMFCVDTSGLAFHINNGVSSTLIRGTNWTPANGTWYHLALTRVGTTYTFYRDGVAERSVTDAFVITDAAAPLRFGFAETSGLNGSVDEVRLFSVARSSAEILAEYQSDTLATHNLGLAYSVGYSTTAGLTWNYVPASSTTLAGVNGTTASQLLSLTDLILTRSTGPAAATNQISFAVSDVAGNVSTTTYIVYVDTAGPLPAGCGTGVNVAKTGAIYNTIQGGLNAIPQSLVTDTCVVVRDTSTYSEQVTVQGFASNNFRLIIRGDSVYSSTAVVVNPPESATAAFDILNSSVSIFNLMVRSTNAVEYGIRAASSSVVLSSVNVDSGGNITTAGISLSTNGTVSYTSVTVQGASGFFLDGDKNSVISFSTAVNSDAINSPLHVVLADSNTVTNSYFNNASCQAANLFSGSDYNTISRSTMIAAGIGCSAVNINGSNGNKVTSSYAQSDNGHALRIDVSNYSVISQSTMSLNAGSFGALYIAVADSNTVTGCMMRNAGGHGAYIDANAVSNTITLSTMVGTGAGSYGLYINQADGNTVSNSYMQNLTGTGAYLQTEANFNTITLSTMISAMGGSNAALFINNSSFTTVSYSMMHNSGGKGAYLDGYGIRNTITHSTMTSNLAAPGAGLYIANSASNTISNSYIGNLNDGYGAYVALGAGANRIDLSTMANNSASYAALMMFGSTNTIIRSRVSNGSTGPSAVLRNTANYNKILLSTITNSNVGNAALFLDTVATNTVSNSYIQGSTAVWVSASTGTAIRVSVLVSTANGAAAVYLGLGSRDLTLTSSTISGPALGSAVAIDDYSGGLITVASSTISGQVQISTLTSGSQVWITSNTILPQISAMDATYGIDLHGLTTGATVQYNGIYYRTAGSMGTRATFGIRAKSARGLNIDHNRISNPGMITGGTQIGARFVGVSNTSFKFNDVNSTGSLDTAWLLQIMSMSTVQVRGNVFMSSLTVTASSATLNLSDESGIIADYNDYFSSNTFNSAIYGGRAHALPTPWSTVTGQDSNSISEHPRWYSPGVGSEDFHPQSKRGRFNPATQAFVLDANTSAGTIDKAPPSPGEPYNNEPTPNGSRANQGSYGNTSEASKSSGKKKVIVIQ